MGKKMACRVILVTLAAMLSIACRVQVSPASSFSTTACPSVPTVTVDTLPGRAQHDAIALSLTVCTSLPTVTADAPESGCTVDEDCTFAFRLDRCCDCGAIVSRQYVDAEPRLLLFHERWAYAYPVPRMTPAIYGGVKCAPCPSPPLGPICAGGICRAAEKWEEIVRLCEKAADSQTMSDCYTQAAVHAYLQVDLDKSLELCNRIQEDVFPGEPGNDYCASTIGRMVLSSDPDRAAAFCLDHLQQSQSRCLKEAGETLAVHNLERGLEICELITVLTDGDRFQRDACFHNIAMQVGETDVPRAREICERMAERADDCKQSVGRLEPVVSPTGEPTSIQVAPTLTPVPTTMDSRPVSILSFEISPAEIWPGEAVTLTWNTIAEQVLITKLDGAGLLTHPAVAVPISGTLVLTTQPTLRNWAGFTLQACSADMSTCEWAGVQAKVACPDVWFFSDPPTDCAGMPHHTTFVAQYFERGLMLWMKASDEVQIYDLIIILYDDEGWLMLRDYWAPGMPEEDPGIIPPSGYDEPRRGFGKVWREMQEVRDRLGWAIGQEFVVGDGTFQCGTTKYSRCYFTGPGKEIYVLEPYGSGWFIWTGSTSVP